MVGCVDLVLFRLGIHKLVVGTYQPYIGSMSDNLIVHGSREFGSPSTIEGILSRRNWMFDETSWKRGPVW